MKIKKEAGNGPIKGRFTICVTASGVGSYSELALGVPISSYNYF